MVVSTQSKHEHNNNVLICRIHFICRVLRYMATKLWFFIVESRVKKRSIRLLAETDVIVSLFATLTPQLSACSLVACIDHGIEVRRDIAVVVRHEGKPLPGISVKITGDGGTTIFSAVTAPDGMVHVSQLSSGDYWIDVTFLGIGAGYHCFHVKEQHSSKAKTRLTYDWGNLGLGTSQVAGTLIDSQLGTGGTPLSNVIHRNEVPISGATLRLQNAINGEAFTATSNENGMFTFSSVHNGTYVLHIEGGQTGRRYDPTDLLLKVYERASRRTLELTRQEPVGTNCGDSHLFVATMRTIRHNSAT